MPIPLSRKQAEQRAQARAPQVAAQTTFVTVDREAAARVLGDRRLQDQIDAIPDPCGNVDGGHPDSVYGGGTGVSGGAP